jgi:predicted amidohydrolase
MKICVAQTKPVKGDIKSNIDDHKKLIDLAVLNKADLIVFPELSITSYEPELAEKLATDKKDSRFDDFQHISDAQEITIGVGVPIKNADGISISMVIFQPHKAREVYSKFYIHPDEEKFFVSKESTVGLIGKKSNVALAICYEISVAEHSENAHKNGGEIYIASVVKTIHKIDLAIKTLSEIASKHSMMVLMSNCVGQANGNICAGKSSIFSNKGELLAQLDGINEGILVIDTDTQEIVEKII